MFAFLMLPEFLYFSNQILNTWKNSQKQGETFELGRIPCILALEVHRGVAMRNCSRIFGKNLI